MKTIEEFLNQPFLSLVIKSDKIQKYLLTFDTDFTNKTVKEASEIILIKLLDIKNSARPALTMSIETVLRVKALLDVIYDNILKYSFNVEKIYVSFNFSSTKIGINIPMCFDILKCFSEDVYEKVSKAKCLYAYSIDVEKGRSSATKHSIVVTKYLKNSCRSNFNNMLGTITDLSTLSEIDLRFYIETKLYFLRLSAYSRQLEFSITYTHMKKLLTRKTCYYFNTPMSLKDITIDRIDNLEGYTNENTVSCCERANAMKNEFIEQSHVPTKFLERIFKFRKEGKIK